MDVGGTSVTCMVRAMKPQAWLAVDWRQVSVTHCSIGMLKPPTTERLDWWHFCLCHNILQGMMLMQWTAALYNKDTLASYYTYVPVYVSDLCVAAYACLAAGMPAVFAFCVWLLQCSVVWNTDFVLLDLYQHRCSFKDWLTVAKSLLDRTRPYSLS